MLNHLLFVNVMSVLLFQVNAVREVITGKSNNEIILVLQYYEYDVAKAIQAYCDGKFQIAPPRLLHTLDLLFEPISEIYQYHFILFFSSNRIDKYRSFNSI